MPEIKHLPGIGLDAIALMKSVGVHQVADLLGYDAESLTEELTWAHDGAKLSERAPPLSVVQGWLRYAEEVERKGEIESAEFSGLDFLSKVGSHAAAEQHKMRTFSSSAANQKLLKSGLKLSDRPVGKELREGVPETRVGEREGEMEGNRFKSIREMQGEGPSFAGAKAEVGEDRVSLIRTPRESTNRGKDPNSRRYVRGVLHDNPWRLRGGGVITLLLMILLPTAIFSGILLMLSEEFPWTFSWVPGWILYLPIALPVVGLAHLIWGRSGKCRICNQRLFVHNAARKHPKRHVLLGLGVVFPLAVHMLLFSWFRCSSCGTPVRLQE